MDDFKIIARLLAAVRAGEGKAAFNCALVDEQAIKAPNEKRDALAIKLQKAGYLEGLFIVDDVDSQPHPVVLWEYSRPAVTLAGLEYTETNAPLRKALQEIKSGAVAAAAQTVAKVLTNM